MRRLKKEFWPICITILTENQPDREIWLVENVGTFRDKWNAAYYANRTDYYFSSESDAALFALKWQ